MTQILGVAFPRAGCDEDFGIVLRDTTRAPGRDWRSPEFPPTLSRRSIPRDIEGFANHVALAAHHHKVDEIHVDAWGNGAAITDMLRSLCPSIDIVEVRPVSRALALTFMPGTLHRGRKS